MGVMLLLAAVPLDVDHETALGNLATISDERIRQVWSEAVSVDIEEEDERLPHLRARLEETLDAFLGGHLTSRTTASFMLDGRTWGFSGGSSSGDSLDDYDETIVLDALGVTRADFERPRALRSVE